MRPKAGGESSAWGGRTAPPPGESDAAPAASPAASTLNSFNNDGSFVKQFKRQEFLYGGSSGGGGQEAEAEEEEAGNAATSEVGGEATGGMDSRLLAAVAARADTAARVPDVGAGGGEASEAGSRVEGVGGGGEGASSVGGGEEEVDLNKLAAKAMKAKLMGRTEEHEKLQQMIARAKAAQPPPPARPRPPQPPPQQQQEGAPRGKTVELMVPASAVGALIGKGGATIDALQSESGARVRIPSDRDGESADERVVLITGSEEAIAAAVGLVEDKVRGVAEREAQLGGKALKVAAKKRERAVAKASVSYEEVPVFDKATGQLTVQRVKVERSRDEEDDATIAALHGTADAASTKRPKKVQRFDGGERTHFFRDDAEETSLNDLVAAERRGGGAGGQVDRTLASSIAKSKRFKGLSAEDEYDYDAGVEMSDAKGSRQSDARRQNQAKSAAASADRRAYTAAERAEQRFSKHRQLIIAVANHVYLRLADVSPLAPAHLVIEPIGQVTCLTEAAEEVADEVRNFQKCLIRMLEANGQHAIFLEQHYAPAGRGASEVLPGAAAASFSGARSMRVECVPLTARDGNAAPAYYRKAILESGEEWSQHRKLHEMKNGSVRGTVPPGFSYFAVGFGVHAGYATVIEDTDEWPADFGRDVLEGIVEHEDAGIPLARRRKEPFERLQQRVVAVTKAFEPYDWTKQL